jgi:hypothetical protein
MGIRSDTMSLVTVFSSQVMLRVGANSDTLLPELNKTPRAVSQPVETEKNGLVVGFPTKKTTARQSIRVLIGNESVRSQ